MYRITRSLFALLICFTGLSRAYDALPRWGQAVVVMSDALCVHGGKTDQFNSFSYTSAPNVNDLLYLSLASSFTSAAPPWKLISTSTNSTASQGPAISWHTLAAFTTHNALLVGGELDATVPPNLPDSPILLDISNIQSPQWSSAEALPTRRIHHSAATSASGLVFIIGGEKADGSQLPVKESYFFNGKDATFTVLPAENGPQDIVGHASLYLPDGRLLVFGGLSQSSGTLNALDTIWWIDTKQSPLTWNILGVSNASLPPPRRAFASTVLKDGSILIHGGSDATLQINFQDGWVLNTAEQPMTWTEKSALSQLGPRRDHFAVSRDNQVIFGFGYANNGPANASLQIFDVRSDSFVSTYTPPPRTPIESNPGSTATHTTDAIASTTLPSDSTSASNSSPDDQGDGKHVNQTSLWIMAGVLGSTSVLLVTLFFVWWSKRSLRTGRARFVALGDEDDNESLHHNGPIPVARSDQMGHCTESRAWAAILSSLGVAGGTRMRNAMTTARRDMFADEDAWEFGDRWQARGRTGAGGSSWSLLSFLGGQPNSREPNLGFKHRREKGSLDDPICDMSLMPRENTANAEITTPTECRNGSSNSDLQGMIQTAQRKSQDESQSDLAPTTSVENHQKESNRASSSLLDTQGQCLQTTAVGGQFLSPLPEFDLHHTGARTDLNPSLSSQTVYSSEDHSSPLGSSASYGASRGSNGTNTTPSSAPFTVLKVPRGPPSSSWWTRLTQIGYLDRRSNEASRRSILGYEIRDPNPPPRLEPIEILGRRNSSLRDCSLSVSECSHPAEQTTPRSRASAGLGKSMTSLHTTNSETLERMGGTMIVAQRVRSENHRTGSTYTTSSLGSCSHDGFDAAPNCAVPTEIPVAADLGRRSRETDHRTPSLPPLHVLPIAEGSSAPPRPTSGSVADRIQEFEQRLKLHQDLAGSVNDTREQDRRRKPRDVVIDYGLVARPNLFIANPDLGKKWPTDASL